MTKVEYQTEIILPIEKVYEYYIDQIINNFANRKGVRILHRPDNIQEAWPRDIVKESENVSGSKSEEGSEMKVKGEYMGREEEMKLQVVDKEPQQKTGNKTDRRTI
jgi:hypothetical protein